MGKIVPNPKYKFVELNRTFHELSSYARESDDVDLQHAFYVRSRLTWEDILKEHRTIILSEAGSGKTEEIRQVAHKLRAKGQAAFFLRLEHITRDFGSAFEVGSMREFDALLAGEEEGWLLLDSVDEARLRDPGDFALAVKNLGRRISSAFDRVHIVVTGRTSAWRPKTDLQLCEQHLPFTPIRSVPTVQDGADNGVDDERDDLSDDLFDDLSETVRTEEKSEDDAQPMFKIVALDELSREQIVAFAGARGVDDTKAFIQAIERADAWSFTARPQDLDELAEFWLAKGRIGSRLELMRNSIDRRLDERDQGRAEARPLAAKRAREGARLIAAAATLGQNQVIRVPDGSENSKGFPLRSILPEWDERDQAALLSRPIFDEAIYGTVRFHHRPVREYLTAEWLAELLSRPSSRRSIESLLFRNQYGLDVIVPTMRPVLPWLAILDDKIGERLRRIAPEVVFEGGDPSALPLPMRKIILAEVCEQLASGASGRSATDYSAVQRFANADLASDIRTLLGRYAGSHEIRGFLIRMVWLGQLTELRLEAKEMALAADTPMYTRSAAFRAVRAVATPAEQKELREKFLCEAASLKRDWLNELLSELESNEETVAWTLAALAKVEPVERYTVDRLAETVSSFVEATPSALLPSLVHGFSKLLDQAPYVEPRFCEVSQAFSWLMKPAARAVERLIQQRDAYALHTDSLDVVYKVKAQRAWGDDAKEQKAEFAKLVPEWDELNRALFWHDVQTSRERIERKEGNRLTSYWQASVFGTFWKFGVDDLDFALDAIQTASDQDDKLVALTLAFSLYVDGGQQRALREKLKSLTSDNQELAERLALLLNPPAQDQTFKRQEAGWKRRSALREKREQEHRDKARKYILEHVPALRNPGLKNPQDISRTQWYLHERSREGRKESNKWTDGRWRDLIPEFGEDATRAYRDGAVAYWRRYRPVTRSEGAQPNTTPIHVIFGLTGIEIEARETPNWDVNLTDDEVRLLCRYAVNELNGFPRWFPKLFARHRALVAPFLLQEILYEFSQESPDEETHYVLDDVVSSGEWAWQELGPSLCEFLKSNDTRNASNLSKVLKIVQGSELSDADVAELAAQKCGAVGVMPLAPQWYALWVAVDPNNAIPAVTQRLDALGTAQERTDFSMQFVTHLWGRRGRNGSVRAAFHTPEHLKSLYLLLHKDIRTSDDIDRANGGVYSPGLRDNAQEARNALFEALRKIPGKAAFLAVEEISRIHPDKSVRPWLISLARTKAEQDADIEPWNPTQVHDYHLKLDRTPTNHRDLAELALLRFLDLKDELEDGDDSIAGILQPVAEETKIRNYLGHRLRDKAFGRYVIPQEEELADAKRPDLRIHGVGFDAPVPAELKLADSWTGPQLFERLENQLAGDYLRDIRSGRGIFALVYRGEKAGWDVPSAINRVDFEGLLDGLRQHWKAISRNFPGVEDISVVGIDLTRRFRSGQSGKKKPKPKTTPKAKTKRAGKTTPKTKINAKRKSKTTKKTKV